AQQSNSSANGTIASPEIATLEGIQTQGGCIAVVPAAPRRGGFQLPTSPDEANVSLGLFPDGNDKDENCSDFKFQTKVNLAAEIAPGTNNIKVVDKGNLAAGQTIFIGTGKDSESAVIKE